MKKFAFFSILALGFGLASCDNDFDFPNPPGQSNPQEPIFETADLELTSGVNGIVNLDQVNNDNSLVALANVVTVENLPEDYQLSFVGQMATSDDFSNSFEFATSVADNIVYANPDDLDAGYHKFFNTIDPNAENTVNIRYKAYAVNGSATIRLGGENVYFCPMTATMTPLNPGFTVEEEYYLIGTCSNGAIDASKAIKLSNGGGSPYDNPEFSAVIKVSTDEADNGYQWAVVPRSTLTAGSGTIFGVSDSELATEREGFLSEYSSNPAYATITEAGPYQIIVNMRPDEDGLCSYKVINAVEQLYVIGTGCDWDFAKAQILQTSNNITYYGYAHLNTEFKLTVEPNWQATAYGSEEKGKLTTKPGDTNIKVDQNGDPIANALYWCDANLVDMDYALTKINTIAIIGDATVGEWVTETVMTPSADFLTWTLKTTLKDGVFKFRANNDWPINLGGSLQDLTLDGADIPAPLTGEVTITLDLSKLPYTATAVK